MEGVQLVFSGNIILGEEGFTGYGYISPWFLQKKYWQAARCNPQHHTGEYMAIYLEDLEGNPTELGKDNFLISRVHLYVIYVNVT
jgi:hypothetical protein